MDIAAFYSEAFRVPMQEFIQVLADHSREEVIKKGETVHNAGEVYESLSFLVDGLLRGYYLDDKGQDITDCFSFLPGTPVMSGISLNEPAVVIIEALEDSRVVTVSCEVLRQLIATDINAVTLYNRMLQTATGMHWQAKAALAQFDTKKRYLWFLSQYPDLIDRVSHKYIASFLGMTPVSLSRVRRELGETKHSHSSCSADSPQK